MRLGCEVFLGCDILLDGPNILANRMWAFGLCVFGVLFERRIFDSHPGQHPCKHLGHILVLHSGYMHIDKNTTNLHMCIEDTHLTCIFFLCVYIHVFQVSRATGLH